MQINSEIIKIFCDIFDKDIPENLDLVNLNRDNTVYDIDFNHKRLESLTNNYEIDESHLYNISNNHTSFEIYIIYIDGWKKVSCCSGIHSWTYYDIVHSRVELLKKLERFEFETKKPSDICHNFISTYDMSDDDLFNYFFY